MHMRKILYSYLRMYNHSANNLYYVTILSHEFNINFNATKSKLMVYKTMFMSKSKVKQSPRAQMNIMLDENGIGEYLLYHIIYTVTCYPVLPPCYPVLPPDTSIDFKLQQRFCKFNNSRLAIHQFILHHC